MRISPGASTAADANLPIALTTATTTLMSNEQLVFSLSIGQPRGDRYPIQLRPSGWAQKSLMSLSGRHQSISCYSRIPAWVLGNQCSVRRQILTSHNITGTSISTPTTVAKAAPEDKPKSIVAVAIATSK